MSSDNIVNNIVITNPVLQSAFENDWYYPATLDADITSHRLYEQAHTEGWHEWIETDLDFEAMKHGYVYDLSRDIEGKPIYWIDGGWQTGQGQRIDVRDEPEQIGYVGAGDAMMRFCETFLRFTKAPLVGKPYRYLPWNRKAVATMFGWVRHTDQTKVRRYRYAYICTGKKNSKSYTVSSIADYMLVADGTPRGEVYVCACDRNQAGIIYREAVDMAQHGTLGAMVEPKESKSRLLYPENGSFLQVLAADAHRNDGVDSSAVLIDEIHRHPNRKLYDVMERSGMARPQPLLVVITTYGPSLTDGSIWAEIHNEARAQMNGDRPHSWRRLNIIASAEPITVTATANLQPGATRIPVLRLHQPVDAGPIEFDLSQFGETGAKAKVEVLQPARRFQTHLDVAPIECEIPRFSEATANLEWCTLHGVKRANPSADVIFPAQDVLDIARDSRSPEKEAQTKQLNFNIVSGSGKRWLSSAVWRACGNLQVQPKSLIGRSAFVGFDFSFGGDLVGLGLAFPKWDISIPFIDVTNPRIDLLTWAWVPEEGIEEREKKEQFPYRTYAKQPYLLDDKGCIRICEGRVADFGQIVTEALEIFEMFNIVAIAYDPAYAQFAIPKFEEKGLTCVAHRQGAISMSPPVKRFQEMIYNGQIAHGNNPVLDRAVEGAELHPVDKAGNTYLSKGRSKNRIDALVAQVMAVGFATNPPVQQSGAYADASTGMWG